MYTPEYNGYLISLPSREFKLGLKQYSSGYSRFVKWRNASNLAKMQELA